MLEVSSGPFSLTETCRKLQAIPGGGPQQQGPQIPAAVQRKNRPAVSHEGVVIDRAMITGTRSEPPGGCALAPTAEGTGGGQYFQLCTE